MTLLLPSKRSERINHKRRDILRFLREETWTHVSVLRPLLGFKNVNNVNSTLRTMERDGLVKRAQIETAYGRPISVVGITSHGLNYAFDLSEELQDRPVFEPSKVNPSTMQHRFDLQLAHVKATQAGWKDWEPGHLLGRRMPGVKLPDAVATNLHGQRVAIELERTLKSRRRYTDILVSHLQQKKAGSWDRIVYLSPTPDLAARVQRAYRSIDQAKHNGQVFTVTDQHLRPFSFFSFDSDQWLNQEV